MPGKRREDASSLCPDLESGKSILNWLTFVIGDSNDSNYFKYFQKLKMQNKKAIPWKNETSEKG